MRVPSTKSTTDLQLKLFVSYSRRDLQFADRLVAALEARSFEVLIDRRDLPKLEDWEAELLGFIRQSDTVVFIVSPHSISSPVCQWEVEQVRANFKRLAPIVIADMAGVEVPAAIAKINYIFFTDPSNFEGRVDELAFALNADVGWLKEHTRLSEFARRWVERGRRTDALIRGAELDEADSWAVRRPREAPAISEFLIDFLSASRRHERELRRRDRRLNVLLISLLLGVIAIGGMAYGGWLDPVYLEGRVNSVRNTMRESGLKPGEVVRECHEHCPAMVVVPAGSFVMGSGDRSAEQPAHKVEIRSPTLIAAFETTFEQWDACVARGGCTYRPSDERWGRGRRPVINVSWDDIQQYLAFLSKLTGKPYRLLSEAEWEYAARAGTTSRYWWGDQVKRNGATMANCADCGSEWDFNRTAPVGSFPKNSFGLHDMHGNVTEWVQDVAQDNYLDAPSDGSARRQGNLVDFRMIRGGSWFNPSAGLRSANRAWVNTTDRGHGIGFRVARSLGTVAPNASPEISASKAAAPATTSIPLRYGQVVLLDGWRNYKQSGFNFRTQQVVAWNSLDGDILVAKSDGGRGAPEFFMPGVEAGVDAGVLSDQIRAGIAEVAGSSLADILACPRVGYSYGWFQAAVGRVYCVRGRTGRSYAAILVTRILDDRIEFDWVYNPSGEETFRR